MIVKDGLWVRNLKKEDMLLALRSFQHTNEKDEMGKLAVHVVKDS